MTKALVETTLVVDQLFGGKAKRDAAQALLGQYAETRTPTYALLEFRAGYLGHLIYAYNVLVESTTVEDAHERIRRASYFQQRKMAGASMLIRALEAAMAAPRVPEQDPRQATLAILGPAIIQGWEKRKSTAKAVSHPLSCFLQDEVVLENKQLRTKSGVLGCQKKEKCGAAEHLKAYKDDVEKLIDALRPKKGVEQKVELAKMRAALKEVLNADTFPTAKCRRLGDAYFCLVAAAGEDILTTNKGDYELLTGLLGKKAVNP